PRLDGVPADIARVARGGLAADPARRPRLAQFVADLRGALNRTTVDTFPQGSPAAGVTLRLAVRLRGRRDAVPATRPPVPTRDLRRVPPPPASLRLRTGDEVEVEVIADRAGYLTLFNVGPTG